MSKQEARKITIIEELLAGRFTNKQAAERLDISVRQVQRIKAEASTNGIMSILHKNRERKPSNALDPEVVNKICRIYQTDSLLSKIAQISKCPPVIARLC